MPIISSIESRHQLIVHRCRGTLNIRDFIEAFDASIQLYGYRSGMNVMWDVQQLNMEVPFGNIQQLVSHVGFRRQKRGTGYRLAIIAGSTIQSVVSNIFTALASPLSFTISIFDNEEDARSWLNEPLINSGDNLYEK